MAKLTYNSDSHAIVMAKLDSGNFIINHCQIFHKRLIRKILSKYHESWLAQATIIWFIITVQKYVFVYLFHTLKTSYGPYGKLNQLRNEFITLLRSEKIDRLT